MAVKDYLGYEQARNKKHAALYERLIKLGVHRLTECKDIAVLIGHHLTFELDSDLNTENEIPSADALIFDHDLMKAVFGDVAAIGVMVALAQTPCDQRDAELEQFLNVFHPVPQPA